jgi:microcystin-dependent protein
MSNAFLGQITMFAGNYAPRGTAFCNGQLLSIAQNSALFSLLGTTYGGNGVNTFALPNLQSSITVHQGQGPGLSNYILGQTAGSASVTLDQNTTPTHMHTFNATQSNASSASIGNTLLAGKPTVSGGELYAVQQAGLPLQYQNMNPAACANAGGSQPHTNLMPSLCITFIIFLQGIYPSRN